MEEKQQEPQESREYEREYQEQPPEPEPYRQEESLPEESTPSTSSRSLTLTTLKLSPEVACNGCPNAIWFQVRNELNPKIMCGLMRKLIDQKIELCDGTVAQEEKQMP